ncbi:hypothetical protein TKK_0005251 [Trichogramma kaykai]
MESRGIDCTVRIKIEPCDVSLTEEENNLTSETPYAEIIQHSSFLHENSTLTLQENDEIKIEIECEDMKPGTNLLAVTKIEDNYSNHCAKINYSEDHKTRNIIKVEKGVGTVKQEFRVNETKNPIMNYNCELNELNRKRNFTNELKNKCRRKGNADTMHRSITHNCVACGKKYSNRGNLHRHMKSMLNDITHACDACGKSFSRKAYLKRTTDSVPNGIRHACDICKMKFTQKGDLKIHIDSVHNKVMHVIRAERNSILRGMSNITLIRNIKVSPSHVIYVRRNSL